MRGFLFSLLLLCGVQCAPPPLYAADTAVKFKLVNDGPAALDEQVYSFGQVFRPGAIRPGERLQVTLDGAAAPAQMDAKALYQDGSVRHAVVAVGTPKIPAGRVVDGLISTDRAPTPVSLVRPPLAPPNLVVEISYRDDGGATKKIEIDLSDLALGQSSRTKPWLDGPLVREQRYLSPEYAGLQVMFDLWTPVKGPSRVDVIFHNDTAQNPDIDTLTYSVRFLLDRKEIYRADNIGHYAHSTWRRAVYVGDKPSLRYIPDLDLLKAVGATPNYGVIRPDRGAMAKLRRSPGDDPLSSAGVTRYMPTTGGRADIGPLPTWAAFYLLEPSRENEATLFANADAAGAVPWHVRDEKTHGPINIDRYPNVWLDGRGQATPGILARKFYISDTDWQPDDAHQPSLTYLPYLLTGSQYYRDELTQQAGYVLLAMDPRYRGQGAGLVLGSQIRAMAWDLRTLANAAYILPASDPYQAYFEGKLKANLLAISNRYVRDRALKGAGELEGYIPGPYGVDRALPPWQNDYLAMVLGWINTMGYTEARPILDWMTNFVAGRFTNEKRGYDPIYGTPYFLFVTRSESGAPIDRWAEAFQATFDPDKRPVRQLDSPDWGGGYAALARASLASIMNATQSRHAARAYEFVRERTPLMDATYSKDPTFAIVPASGN